MIKLNGKIIYNGEKFPNKESFIDLEEDIIREEYLNIIEVIYEDDSDLLQLIFLREKIKETKEEAQVDLVLPYFPYSRMDREEEKRLFSLKYFCKILKDLNFRKIKTFELHSNTPLTFLDNLENYTKVEKLSSYIEGFLNGEKVRQIAKEVKEDLKIKGIKVEDIGERFIALSELSKKIKSSLVLEEKPFIAVLPDKGAEKRFGEYFEKKIIFEKKRDFNTGKILEIKLKDGYEIEENKNYVIFDDLCSKGGTFIPIIEKLREKNNRVFLAVTHLEENVLNGNLLESEVEKIFTVFTKVENDKVEVMPEIDFSFFNLINASPVGHNIKIICRNSKEKAEKIYKYSKESLKEKLEPLTKEEEKDFKKTFEELLKNTKENSKETKEEECFKDASKSTNKEGTIYGSKQEEQLEKMKKLLEKAKLDTLIEKAKETLKEENLKETKEERR